MRALAEIVHLRTGDCREAAAALPQIAADERTDVDPAAIEHVAQCLRCQAEVAASRRLLRIMRSMAGDSIEFPADGIASVIAALEAAGTDGHHAAPTWAVRAAYVGGITVATAAAGAAGVLVWMSRRRLAPTA